MNHPSRPAFALACVWCLSVAGGCGEAERRPPTAAEDAIRKERLLGELAEAAREAERLTPPAPVIDLTLPGAWKRTDLRSLPVEEVGFSVALSHEAGPIVTLYQYTRGLKSISDSLESEVVQRELTSAADGIRQMVDLGLWKSAERKESGTVMLGDSKRPARRDRFDIETDGARRNSETYVWIHSNAILKVRCTFRTDDPVAEAAVLRELLTALGNASQAAR